MMLRSAPIAFAIPPPSYRLQEGGDRGQLPADFQEASIGRLARPSTAATLRVPLLPQATHQGTLSQIKQIVCAENSCVV